MERTHYTATARRRSGSVPLDTMAVTGRQIDPPFVRLSGDKAAGGNVAFVTNGSGLARASGVTFTEERADDI